MACFRASIDGFRSGLKGFDGSAKGESRFPLSLAEPPVGGFSALTGAKSVKAGTCEAQPRGGAALTGEVPGGISRTRRAAQ